MAFGTSLSAAGNDGAGAFGLAQGIESKVCLLTRGWLLSIVFAPHPREGRIEESPARFWHPLWLWVGVYLLLALIAYSPLWVGPFGVVPAGKVPFGVVSLFNLWTIWWNADRLWYGLAGYWDAPIFWPERGTFALSEPQAFTLAVSPVVWFFGPTLAFHVYCLGNLVLNGIFAFRLARTLGTAPLTAGLAGALVTWHPLVMDQPELTQWIPLWPVLWSWEATIRLARTGRIVDGTKIAIPLAIAVCVGVNLAIFNALVLLCGALAVALKFRQRETAIGVLLGFLVAAIVSLILILPMWRALTRHGQPRPPQVVRALSASPSDWLSVPKRSLFPGLEGATGSGRPLLPGIVRTLLAFLGAYLLVKSNAWGKSAAMGSFSFGS